MESSTKQKRSHLRFIFIPAKPNNKFPIDMPIQENMYRPIPFPIKLLISSRIPPILIKFSMIQFRNFGKNISNIFESEIK